MENVSFISPFNGNIYHFLRHNNFRKSKSSKITSNHKWSANATGSNSNKKKDNNEDDVFRFHRFVRNGKNSNDDKNIPPNQRFERFDGSLPLLPAWRPPSMEADFAYNAKRVSSRENETKRKEDESKPIVKIESPGYGTLFAQVVQFIDSDNESDDKYWLRPLLLSHEEDATFIDLRGGSDIFVKKDKVINLDNETKTRVIVNLVATESDVLRRVISDEDWNRCGIDALFRFLNSL